MSPHKRFKLKNEPKVALSRLRLIFQKSIVVNEAGDIFLKNCFHHQPMIKTTQGGSGAAGILLRTILKFFFENFRDHCFMKPHKRFRIKNEPKVALRLIFKKSIVVNEAGDIFLKNCFHYQPMIKTIQSE